MLLVIDPDLKQAFDSLFSEQPLNIPNWQHGSTVPLTVALVDRIPSPQTPRIFEPRSLAGMSMRAALGQGFLVPRAGVWFILSGIDKTVGPLVANKRYKILDFNAGDDFVNVGGVNVTGNVFTATGTTPTVWANGSTLQEATADIVFNPTAAQIQTALDATAWETAAGGITVTGEDGFFFFTFTTDGARVLMSGDTTDLAPPSIADFGELLPGSNVAAEVQIMRLVQNPAAFTSLTIRNDEAAAAVQPVQTGGAGLNAKARVLLTARQSGVLITGGIYNIVAYVAGDDFTNVGGTNVTGNTFTASGTTPTTWTNGSVLRRTNALPPYDGQFSITVQGLESAMIDFDADEGTVQEALENITITEGPLVVGAKYKIVEFLGTDDFTNVGAASNATDVVFVASGTTPTDWAALSVLTPVGAGNVSVAKEAFGTFLLAFQGDMANTDMGDITADGSGLQVLSTLSGVLDLRTAGIDVLLNGETSVPIDFEIEFTPLGESVQKAFREAGTLTDSLFDPSNTPPAQVNTAYFTGTLGSGETFTAAVGSSFTINGNLEGAPTSGTLDLSNVQLTFASYASQVAVALAALPPAANGIARGMINDSDAAMVFGDVAIGGGAEVAPVYSDGTDWRWG